MSEQLAGALAQYSDADLRLLALRLGVTEAPLEREDLLMAVMDAASALAAGLVSAVDSRAAAIVSGTNMAMMSDMDRVIVAMDEIKRDVSGLRTDIEVIKTRLATLDNRLAAMERDIHPTPTWQTWLMLVAGLAMTVVVVLALMRLGAG